MHLPENERELSKAIQQLVIRCTKQKKPESARYTSDEKLRTNPQEFVCMLCPADRRRRCNSASALVSHHHRSHGYHNPFGRAAVDDSCLACKKKFGNREETLDHIAYRAKKCRHAFLDGCILWATEENTAHADELDRKETAKTGPN